MCKSFQSASHSKHLWHAIMELDILRKGLPTPAYCRHIDTLSSDQCEALTIHSLRLSERKKPRTSESPRSIISIPQSRSVTWVKLIRGQWLLSACSNHTSSTLCLWSLDDLSKFGNAARPSALAYLEGPVAAGLIDIQDDDRLIIALEIRAES